jgi:hypothetical protein
MAWRVVHKRVTPQEAALDDSAGYERPGKSANLAQRQVWRAEWHAFVYAWMGEAQPKTDRKCGEAAGKVRDAMLSVEPDDAEHTAGIQEGLHAIQRAGEREMMERGECADEVIAAAPIVRIGHEVCARKLEIAEPCRRGAGTLDDLGITIDRVDATGEMREGSGELPGTASDVERAAAWTRHGAKEDVVVTGSMHGVKGRLVGRPSTICP